MELTREIRIGDLDGRTHGIIKNCTFRIDKFFSGYDLVFGFKINSFGPIKEDSTVVLRDLRVNLSIRLNSEVISLGLMDTPLNYYPKEMVMDGEFSLSKKLSLATNDFIRLIDFTYSSDVSFEFEVLPIFQSSYEYSVQSQQGWLNVPQAVWFKHINKLDLDRFELITIRVPVASSHRHKPFADALSKIREAEESYKKGDLRGAVIACRSAWETVLSVVPSGAARMEYMLSTVSADPHRHEFALAVLKGFKGVIDKGIHLEGNVKTSMPSGNLKPEDVLLCIHWYSAAIGYLSQI